MANTPQILSSRPVSDRGVTFHFKHSFVSKSAGARTPAAAHQSYIERDSAADRDGQDVISFGTIGSDPKARRAFWRKLEEAESLRGRVQCRMVLEIPHELDREARKELAERFCGILAARGLPYWCALHAPTERNDRRNYHMHIVYSDRPADRLADGRWDFEIVERRRYKNRGERPVRPYKQNKDRDARGPDWVKTLRTGYATFANEILARSGAAKRLDPRPYSESGVAKEPTTHLGPQAWSLEKAGSPTRAGAVNHAKEMLFRTTAWSALAIAQWKRVETLIVDTVEMIRAHPVLKKAGTALKNAALRYRDLTLALFTKRREEETHRILREALVLGDERRRAHLVSGSLRDAVLDRKARVSTPAEIAAIETRLEAARPQADAHKRAAARARAERDRLRAEQAEAERRLETRKREFDEQAEKIGAKPPARRNEPETWARTLVARESYRGLHEPIRVLPLGSERRPPEASARELARFDEAPSADAVARFVSRFGKRKLSDLEVIVGNNDAAIVGMTDLVTRTAHIRASRLLTMMIEKRRERDKVQVVEPKTEKTSAGGLDI